MRQSTRSRSAAALGWVVTAAVGSLLVTQLLAWHGTTIVATLQALTPVGLAAVAVVTVVAALARAWVLTIVSSLVVVGILVVAAPLAFSDARLPADATQGVRVASINLLYSNARVDEVADDLSVRSPDVIAFSEYTPEHRRVLEDHPFAARYPYRVDLDDTFASGMAVWSAHPIIDREPFVEATRGVGVTIAGPDGPIRVVAVHPTTPVSDFEGWRRALRTLADTAPDSPTPTIVVGDFNASFWHPGFRDLLDAGFTDAHVAAGRGWSTSWPTDEAVPAFVRLDHALTDDRLAVTELVDFDPPGSDHRAFVVTVAPTEPDSAG